MGAMVENIFLVMIFTLNGKRKRIKALIYKSPEVLELLRESEFINNISPILDDKIGVFEVVEIKETGGRTNIILFENEDNGSLKLEYPIFTGLDSFP
ncbi:MAG: hypothetical protein QMD86_00725 [Patescibacteria group bacterium]|nr:hypothetical protein [Patescibacteria group bacterium]